MIMMIVVVVDVIVISISSIDIFLVKLLLRILPSQSFHDRLIDRKGRKLL
jgi:hypothetical protein